MRFRVDLRVLTFRAATMLAALGVLLVAGEIAIRLVVPTERWSLRDSTSEFIVHPVLGWVLGPNLDSSRLHDMTGEVVRIRTNADGVMPADAAPTRRAGLPRVMIVGDSTVVGSSVHEHERIHSQLREQLRARGISAEVVNAGTGGWATDQSMLRLEQLIDRYAPDFVLHCVCANDFAGNKSASFNGINKPRFVLDERGKLLAVAFEPSTVLREYVDYGSLLSRIVQRLAVYRILRPKILVLRARFGDWEDRNLLGLTNEWYTDPGALERVDWLLFKALIRRMQDLCTERGIEFAVYSHPALGAVWDPYIEREKPNHGTDRYDRYALERRIHEELAGIGVTYYPLVAYFAERQQLGPFHLLPRDPHCNGVGYRLQAEALADHLATGGLGGEKTKFAPARRSETAALQSPPANSTRPPGVTRR